MHKIISLILLSLFFFTAKGQNTKEPSATASEIDQALDSTFRWFRHHPFENKEDNFASRWQKTALLDKYGTAISHTDWNLYRSCWGKDSAKAAEMENIHPILHYLRTAAEVSVAEIKNTKIKKGVVIWKLYNMGYVIKTRDACFAIDLVLPNSTKLADLLDFAIVSHAHGDHTDSPFLQSMVARKKAVYSPFYPSGTIIDTTRELNFGDLHIRFTMNDQGGMPVIVSQIDCGTGANRYTIYDVADARILSGLNPTGKVNLLVLHIQNGLDVFEAVDKVKPDLTVYDHVLELGHPVDKYRWTYDYTYRKLQNRDPAVGCVLTWGERLEVGVTASE